MAYTMPNWEPPIEQPCTVPWPWNRPRGARSRRLFQLAPREALELRRQLFQLSPGDALELQLSGDALAADHEVQGAMEEDLGLQSLRRSFCHVSTEAASWQRRCR